MRPFSAVHGLRKPCGRQIRELPPATPRFHYINTTNWLSAGDYVDGLHPSVSGHIKAANLLKPILAPYISVRATDIQSDCASQRPGLGCSHQSTTTQSDRTMDLQWRQQPAWTVNSLGGNTTRSWACKAGRTLEVAGASTAMARWWTSGTLTMQPPEWTITPTDSGYIQW